MRSGSYHHMIPKHAFLSQVTNSLALCDRKSHSGDTISNASCDVDVKHIVKISGHPLEVCGCQTKLSHRITDLKVPL